MPCGEDKYDAIVIGSGIGGMACAGILAKLNRWKVLVLEKHSAAGGLTLEFQRQGGYKWDVGVHYIGEMGKGTLPRIIMDYISDNNLKWTKIPDPFEKFVYPNFTFEVFSEPGEYMNGLIALFPDEEKAIRAYFKDIEKSALWFIRNFLVNLVPFYLKVPLQISNIINKQKAIMTTQNYLDNNFKNEKLKALLVSQWGAYGLTPKKSAFVTHAIVVSSCFKGAYYPEGGGGQIAKSITSVIEKAGGKCLLNREVTQVIIENDRAIGVKVIARTGMSSKQEEYYAPIIISDAGAHNTYLRLIPERIDNPFREEITSFPQGPSAVILYLALKESPEKLGFKGENHWIYSGYDHNKAFDEINSFLLEGKPKYCFLSFPSLKDTEPSIHTAEAVALCDYKIFAKWKDQPQFKKDKEYYELKEKISEGLINLIEERYRGFKDLIIYKELSTPLTIESLSSKQSGEIYGVPPSPERYAKTWCRVNTPIKNLYLTGSDACAPGVLGGMWAGVAVASVLNGALGFFKVMYHIGRAGCIDKATSVTESEAN